MGGLGLPLHTVPPPTGPLLPPPVAFSARERIFFSPALHVLDIEEALEGARCPEELFRLVPLLPATQAQTLQSAFSQANTRKSDKMHVN